MAEAGFDSLRLSYLGVMVGSIASPRHASHPGCRLATVFTHAVREAAGALRDAGVQARSEKEGRLFRASPFGVATPDTCLPTPFRE